MYIRIAFFIELRLRVSRSLRSLANYFKTQQESAFEKMNKRSRTAAIAQVAAHRLIAKALQMRKQYVGLLLKMVKRVWVTYQRAV